jgi:hypothetical protein
MKAAQEQVHLALATTTLPSRKPIMSCLALGCYGFGLLIWVSVAKAKGHDAVLGVVGGILFGSVTVVLGGFCAVVGVARKEQPGYLPALAVAVLLGILVVLLLTRLI